jgi:AAA domain
MTATSARKRLRQLSRIRTIEDLRAHCRVAREAIKRREIAFRDACDDLYEMADRSGLTARYGAEFVEQDIRVEITAGDTIEPDDRPDYFARVFGARELQVMRFEPVRYVLPGLIPDGLTILAAKPKAKKSWFVLDLCIGVAGDRYVLGNLKPAEGDVLYLALEDSPRRLQRRMDKLLGACGERPGRLEFATEWPRLNEGGLADLDAWCVVHPNARLIVIDTFEKVRPPDGRGRLYGIDYDAIGPLHRLAHEHGVAIILVHHTRKMDADDIFDTVSGSHGLTGAADTILVLQRQGSGVTLHAVGRDIDQSETAMQFNSGTCRWSIVGTLGGAVDVRMSDERRRVLDALANAEERLSTNQIREAAGLGKRNTADVLLRRMVSDGQIVCVARGKYDLPNRPQSDRSDESDCVGGEITH